MDPGITGSGRRGYEIGATKRIDLLKCITKRKKKTANSYMSNSSGCIHTQGDKEDIVLTKVTSFPRQYSLGSHEE